MTLQDYVIKECDDFTEGNSYQIDNHRHWVDGYIILVCQAILQNHVVICSFDFMVKDNQGKSPSYQILWP